MTYTDKHIVETYSDLFEGLSAISKIELIENLSKSLKVNKKKRAADFFKSFGAFASKSTAEEMIAAIRASRKFRKKSFKL
jgi:hypothetical protein